MGASGLLGRRRIQERSAIAYHLSHCDPPLFFRLQYQNDQNSSSQTAFAFTVQYKGTPRYPLPPEPIDCTHSDVDQIQIFVEPTAVNLITQVQVGKCRVGPEKLG